MAFSERPRTQHRHPLTGPGLETRDRVTDTPMKSDAVFYVSLRYLLKSDATAK